MAKYTKTQFIKLQKELVTDKAIGERLGLSQYNAYLMRTKFKIPSNVARKSKRNEKIIRAFKNGSSVNELAKKFSLQNNAIYQIIIKAGLNIKKLRPKYTKQQFIDLQKKLVTDKEIGKRLGVSRQAVHQMRRKFKIPSNGDRNTERNEKIIRAFKNGLSTNELAKKFNLHCVSILIILKTAGLQITKLKIKRNNAMKAAYKKGLTGPAIAEKFGLSLVQTYNIVNESVLRRAFKKQ